MQILQITDTHLYADSRTKLLGINTQQSLNAVLHKIRNESKKPDAVLLTGDLSQDCSVAAYKKLAKSMLATFKCPVLWLPGNHDEPKTMTKVFAKTKLNNNKIFRQDNWQIILLNSHSSGNVHGYLVKKELAWLEKCLKEAPHLNTLITLHHHPIPVHCNWLDKLGLKNTKPFLKIIDKYKNVRCVLWGHIHQKFAAKRHGIHYLATPSTCIQFKPKLDGFALDEKGKPGYRWLHLKNNGAITSVVKRANDFDMTIDLESTGY